MKAASEKILALIVPAEKHLREEIRRKTDLFFSENKICPPVSFDRLAGIAADIMLKNGWSPDYRAFVMVCAGNAIWRPVVSSVPFDRRLLLLPQCLKNSTECRALQDELGLLCCSCGNCNISFFLDEAEKLGYHTIVAEGTTIASRLVESGTVDAIIGVSCMEVLQKIFRDVNKYSVPALGIPLLRNGCTDTEADTDWIIEEIRHFRDEEGCRLININVLKEKVVSWFSEKQINHLLNLSQNQVDSVIREILLAGGKRLRPLLTALAYEAFCRNPDQEVLIHLAMSIECFHKASLVHDDIEDGDELRYGKETVHARYGVPVAINTGDLLVGEGYRLLGDCTIGDEKKVRCLKIISEGHTAMAKGQGNELLARRNRTIPSVNEVLDIFRNKTGEAFRVSLLTGAIAGGADKDSIDLLESFSYLIGIAYQLNDDLEDITETPNKSVPENPSSVISVLAEKAGPEKHEKIMEAVEKNDMTALLKMISDYSVQEQTELMIKNYLQKTELCLSGLKNIPLKIALHEIVGKTFSRYL